jgi:hypothetical protein
LLRRDRTGDPSSNTAGQTAATAAPAPHRSCDESGAADDPHVRAAPG